MSPMNVKLKFKVYTDLLKHKLKKRFILDNKRALWYCSVSIIKCNKGEGMREKFLTVRMPADLVKRYRVLCVKMELSVPKQTAELIRAFVEIQEQNNNKIEEIKKQG